MVRCSALPQPPSLPPPPPGARDDALTLLPMQAHGSSPSSDGTSPPSSLSLLPLARARGLPARAASLMRRHLHLARRRSAAISASGRSGDWAMALGLFGAMEESKVAPSVHTVTSLISSLDKGGEPGKVRRYPAGADDRGWLPRAQQPPPLHPFCALCARVHLALTSASSSRSAPFSPVSRPPPGPQALALFDTMPSLGLQPSAQTYNAAISACRRLRDSSRAVQLLRAMQEEGGSLSPTAISYNAAIAASEWSGSPELAMGLVEEMRQAGLAPDNHTCAAACRYAPLRAVARRYLPARRCLLTPAAAGAKMCCAPDAPPCSFPLCALPTPSCSYAAAITACGRCGDGSSAMALYERMQADGLTPDLVTRVALVSAVARSGDWKGALAVFAGISTADRNQQAYAAALSACARGGQRVQARALLKEMRAVGCTVGVREATMAAAACKADGAWRDALAILEELEGGKGGTGGIRADSHALRTVYHIARAAAAGGFVGKGGKAAAGAADATEASAAADRLLKRLLTDGAVVDDSVPELSGQAADQNDDELPEDQDAPAPAGRAGLGARPGGTGGSRSELSGGSAPPDDP